MPWTDRISWLAFAAIIVPVGVVAFILFAPLLLILFLYAELIYNPIRRWYSFRGGVEQAWQRCLPVWLKQRRAVRVARSPFLHDVSTGTYLAYEFAARFRKAHEFLLSRASAGGREGVCAIEILATVCVFEDTFPAELLQSALPLPTPLVDGHIRTLGHYLERELREAKDPDRKRIWQLRRLRSIRPRRVCDATCNLSGWAAT
jgi:hypothetical protein